VTFPEVNWLVFSPPLVLLVTACVALLFAIGRKDSKATAILSLLGLAVAAGFNTWLFVHAQEGVMLQSFGLRYVADTTALALNYVILLGTAFALMISYDYLRRPTGLDHPEYYPLMLLSATGALVIAAAGDLIVLILGVEIMSLATYVLCAWRQEQHESEEAGMKYFLLGAFSTAFFVYGIALTYGATGSFTFTGIATAAFSEGFNQGLLLTLGALMMLIGLAFKVALAPFHQWAPDAYTGAPTPITAYMSVVVKAAAFAAIMRVAIVALPTLSVPGTAWTNVLAVLVALTLIIGNFVALRQRGVKRMLAYSAVAHAGYLSLAVLAASGLGMHAAIWYLTAYTLMAAGAFAVLTLLSDNNDKGDDIERFAGLGQTRPWLAAALAIFMLSLAGIPPTAGFAAKILVFHTTIAAGYLWLALLAILTSIIAVYYYARVVAVMYFREPEYEPMRHTGRVTYAAIALAAVGTVVLGIVPGWWYGILGAGQQFLAGF
jgi:NADH-quinone oxidoreductase subunit N